MKYKFFSLLIVLLVLTTAACLAENNTDTSDAADTPSVPYDPAFCADVNAIRKRCADILVDCVGQLKNTSQDLVSKIQMCPISVNMDMMPPSGKFPEISVIPCCVEPIIGKTQ